MKCAYPVLFRKPFHLVVEQKVDSERVAGTVGEHRAQDLAVLVTHVLSHMEQYHLINLLNMDPEGQGAKMTV